MEYSKWDDVVCMSQTDEDNTSMYSAIPTLTHSILVSEDKK